MRPFFICCTTILILLSWSLGACSAADPASPQQPADPVETNPGEGPPPSALRTPDEQFSGLPGYTFTPHYFEFDGLRVHYLDEGVDDAGVMLLLHGEPSWSYLYREMIPVFVQAGYRVIAPDLIGFGRSDKPVEPATYSYQLQVDMIKALIQQLGVSDVRLFVQDWGGLIGLRVAAEMPARFGPIVAANTIIPGYPEVEGVEPPLTDDALVEAREEYLQSPAYSVSGTLQRATVGELSPEVLAAYDAPFPEDDYLTGPRTLPLVIPYGPDDEGYAEGQAAWEVFKTWEKPFLTIYGERDRLLGSAYGYFLALVPGTEGQPHLTYADAGHFIQEDKGEEIASYVVAWLEDL